MGLAQPFIVPYNGTAEEARVQSIDQPLRTQTTENRFGVAQPVLVAMEHGGRELSADKPLPTITTAKGGAIGVAEAFLSGYYGNGTASPVTDPVPTVTTKDRFALVQPVINGRALDIRFRMLQKHELAAAMSFPKSYAFHGTTQEVIKQIGNSWPGELALALNRVIVEDYAPARRRKEKVTDAA